MKGHNLVLSLIIVTVTLVDDVCARRGGGGRGGRGGLGGRGGRGGRSSIRSCSEGGSSGSTSTSNRIAPRGNSDGNGVFLGGYYADNYRMRDMFSSRFRDNCGIAERVSFSRPVTDISRFRVIDLDKILASKEVKEYILSGELVSISDSGYTRVRTSYYVRYGRSRSSSEDDYYDDDQDIYFDIFEVDTIHNLTNYKNATLKHIQVRKCLHSLRVSKANRQNLLYACYRWHHSPFVILWIPCVILFLMWVVVPVLLSILYIQNMRGQIKSCFLYADSIHQIGKLEEGETLKKNERNKKLKLTTLIGFLTAVLLSVTIACLCLTSNDLYQEDSHDAILKMQLFRAGITFLALILLALLSLINDSLKIKLYKFPLYVAACNSLESDDSSMEDKEDDDDPISIFGIFILCLAGDLCLLVASIALKIVHVLLFYSCGFLTHSLQIVMAKINLKEINLKHFLYYAYLR